MLGEDLQDLTYIGNSKLEAFNLLPHIFSPLILHNSLVATVGVSPTQQTGKQVQRRSETLRSHNKFVATRTEMQGYLPHMCFLKQGQLTLKRIQMPLI